MNANNNVRREKKKRDEADSPSLKNNRSKSTGSRVCALILEDVNYKIGTTTKGCEEYEKIGSGWVHLRLFLTCGHVHT
jgi:hypothetical protein